MREVTAEQAPTVLVSIFIAELFYKFHSFTLECLAFMGTWFAIDTVVQTVRKRWQPQIDTSNEQSQGRPPWDNP